VDGLNLEKTQQESDQACAECAFKIILNSNTDNFMRIEEEENDITPGTYRKFHCKGIQTLIIREINGLKIEKRTEFLWDILLNGRYIGMFSLQR